MLPEPYRQQMFAAVRLSRRPGVGAKRFADLVRNYGSPLAAWEQVGNRPDLFPTGDKALLVEAEEEMLRFFADGGLGVYLGAADYPSRLAAVPEPPPYLFRRGPLWPLEREAVAIVGPRHPTPAGTRFAHELACCLSRYGVAVISGGAAGIDAAAHRGALQAAGGTVLVTATGIDRCYPRENEGLFREVAAGGCLLSELLPGTPPRRDFFPTRNRIIAGLSQALVVVEGRCRSGSASSAAQMRRLDRPVFAWTGADPQQFDLPAEILTRGGRPLAEPSAETVLAGFR